jgi:tetratricopeptide (TPR) repeat protein
MDDPAADAAPPADDRAAGDPAGDAEAADDRAPERIRAERAGRIHGLDADEVTRLEAVFLAQREGSGEELGDGSSSSVVAAVETLQDPLIAEAFLGETLTADASDLDDLDAFAATLLAAAEDRPERALRAAPLWLRARVLDRRGEVLAVEPLLDEALRAAPSFSPALELAARYASDRGNAREAVRLLRAAGVTADDEYLVELTRMIPTVRHDIGRNDPCWCGSGRKYKQCHLNRTTLDLDERAYWLYRKAAEHIGDGPQRARMLDLATALLGEDELTAEAAWMALTDPIVADLVLIHDGAWDEFLAHRGPLLPDDERQLAQRWAAVPQSVFVVTTSPGATTPLGLRDLRSGAEHSLSGFDESSDTFGEGQRLLGRVVSTALDGDPAKETLIGGLLFLDDAVADELLAAIEAQEDALALAQIVGRHHRAAAAADIARQVLAMGVGGANDGDADGAGGGGGGGQRLVTTEGEPLVFCTTTYAIPAGRADDVVAALDRSPVLTRHEDGPDDDGADTSAVAHLPGAFVDGGSAGSARWREEVEAQGGTWIRGTVTVDGDELVLNTNAEPRHDRLTSLLAELAPDLTVVDESRRAAADFST